MNDNKNKERKGGFGRGKRPDRTAEKSEFDSNILDLARVTRVTEGGKHLSFRACVIVGDKKGRVGMGLDKGKDVQIGVEKATRQAKKHLINVPIVNNTIAHPVFCKFKSAQVMIKPAPNGSGIIAGGPVRVILELAGVPNASSKILGKTKNKIVLAEATLGALSSLLPVTKKNKTGDKKVEEVKTEETVNTVKPVAKKKVTKE